MDAVAPHGSSVEDRCLTRLQVMEVSKRVGKRWKELGREMQFEEGTLSNIDHDNRNFGVTETAFQMLLTWQERMPSEATVHTLAKHLQNIGRMDLATLILSQAKTTNLQNGLKKHEAGQNVGQSVDKKVLMELGPILGKDWKSLGREMEIDDATLEAIETDNRLSGLAETSTQLLFTWQREMSDRATAKSLITHLKAIQRMDLANMVKNFGSPKSQNLSNTLQPI